MALTPVTKIVHTSALGFLTIEFFMVMGVLAVIWPKVALIIAGVISVAILSILTLCSILILRSPVVEDEDAS